MADETADRQIETLKDLRQAAATWLLGYKSSRSVRDLPDIPRTSTGGYNAAELVAWARSRQQRPNLTDDDVERILQVVGWTIPDDVACLRSFLDDLQSRHGDAGLLVYCDELIKVLRTIPGEAIRETPPPDLTRAEEYELIQAANRDAREAWYRRRLAYRIVCEKCKRVRHGRRWVQIALADGEPSVRDTCPACEAKRVRR